MPSHNNQLSHGIALAVFVFLAACSVATSDVTPTCESLGESWYFPNDCNLSCETDLGSTMDTNRSRNVNGKLKCYCLDSEQPFCTDSPSCEDLGISPGTAEEDCARVCGDSSQVTANTGLEDNGYQVHYIVSCKCDGKPKCEDDVILFSDTDFMNSCTGGDPNSLEIANTEECDTYCVGTMVFEGGNFAGGSGENKTCSCLSPIIRGIDPAIKIEEAVACDDATARANDGSGLGNPCYETIGVNQVDCTPPSSAASASTNSPPTATKTLVSSGAIMGVWLLPW